jgi:hypothetical protein
MIRFVFLFLLVVFHIFSIAQVVGKVYDAQTGEPLPYVNIVVKGKDIGATTNLDGEFSIHKPVGNASLIITSIGYEDAEVVTGNSLLSIRLFPKTYQLNEVVVLPRKSKVSFHINPLKGKKTTHYVACGESPWRVAQRFDYLTDYSATPFIKSLGILVRSEKISSIFSLRLVEVCDDGLPGNDLLSESIVTKTRLGKRIVTVDLSDRHIVFPEKGLFVMLEWLMVDANKFSITYTMHGEKKKRKGVRYAPMFAVFLTDKPSDLYVAWGGAWRKTNIRSPHLGRGSSELAVELVLSD